MNAYGTVSVNGVGFWGDGLPSWHAARQFVLDGTLPESAPRKPSAELLPANERRRAPDTVALALDAAEAACLDAGADPAVLPSVFVSTHGDLAITDFMCSTLVSDATAISPTRFHNSVHNAASGYWTIGHRCMAPATALSAYRASFAQGLIECLAQLQDGALAVLLVAYDGQSTGALGHVSRSEGLLGGALVLGSADRASARHTASVGLHVALSDRDAPAPDNALFQRYAGNAMAPMLPLFAMLADPRSERCTLDAGRQLSLIVTRAQ